MLAAVPAAAAAASVAFFVSYGLKIGIYPMDKINEAAGFVDGIVAATENEANGTLAHFNSLLQHTLSLLVSSLLHPGTVVAKVVENIRVLCGCDMYIQQCLWSAHVRR